MTVRIRSRHQILADMIVWLRSNSSSITNFNPGGTARAILNATAVILARLYYSISKIYKDSRITTATGSALDDLLAGRGMVRLKATKSSTVCIFVGTSGTVIPSGTQVSSSGGVVFETTKQGYEGKEISVESLVSGKSSNVNQNTLTIILTSVSGINSVHNPVSATGGTDYESDQELRSRAVDQLATLSKGIRASYEAWSRNANEDVLRAFAQGHAPGYSADTVLLHLVKNTGGDFESVEIRTIEKLLIPMIPLGTAVKAQNIVWTSVNISATIALENGYNLNTVKNNVTQNLQLYLNWRIWTRGEDLDWADVLSIVNNTLGVKDVEQGDFIPASPVTVGDYSLPKLGSVTLTERDSLTSKAEA